MAVENFVDIGFFVAGASIFDELIGLHDVIADLLTPAGRFASAKLVDRFGVLLELHLDKFAEEDFHGFFFVLELGAFVLDGNDGIGGDMSDTDGGICGVDRLTTVTTGVINVDAEIFFVDFDVGVGLDNRENFDESEGGLAKVIGVEGREADEAMDTVLGF